MDNEKLNYMRTASNCAGFYIVDKELDLLVSLYELITSKGGDATMSDVVEIKASIESKYSDLPIEEEKSDSANNEEFVKQLNEKWYSFKRFTCKDNTIIDIWTGDAANNPNDEKKNNYNLNSFVSYYRKNNDPWVHQNSLIRGVASFISLIYENYQTHTADQIWQLAIEIEQNKQKS